MCIIQVKYNQGMRLNDSWHRRKKENIDGVILYKFTITLGSRARGKNKINVMETKLDNISNKLNEFNNKCSSKVNV